MHVRARSQQAFDHLGACINQVLAVVEHQQHLAGAQRLGQSVKQRLVCALAHPERFSHAARHQPGVDQRCQLYEPDTLRIPLHQSRRDAQRQARFAHATGTDECQQPRVSEKAASRSDSALSRAVRPTSATAVSRPTKLLRSLGRLSRLGNVRRRGAETFIRVTCDGHCTPRGQVAHSWGV